MFAWTQWENNPFTPGLEIMKRGITVSYSGVHQAYQLALAAEELGRLDHFYCSLFAGTNKWGGALARLLGPDKLINRGIDGVSPDKARENPWPLLAHRFRAKLRPATANDWVTANGWFDGWVARQLKRSESAVFVGVETCASESFALARKRGMVCVLDCPGVDASVLDGLALEAARTFGLVTVGFADPPAMRERKRREIELADAILVCSEVQERTFRAQTATNASLYVVPLWVDSDFWRPAEGERKSGSGPLRALFVGKVNIRKGVPFLVRAMSECNKSVSLTLVGGVDDELRPFLNNYEGKINILPPCVKTELRKHYRSHDLLVLPSLGDSFGFVAMEAMACGLPVVVSENCGAPVPDPSWRVPVMDSAAIARRFEYYAANPQALEQDRQVARGFALRFTPELYREKIKELYLRLLEMSA
jgi:glycosyltransferase involved in cell wall biosynthesis